MEETLKILILEDNPDDAELMVYGLKKAGLKFSWKRVETESAFKKELEEAEWSAVFSDYSLIPFTGLEAFKLFKKKKIHIPFILVTGSLDEETAVECMREGMDDYILKESLSRLSSALIHALEKKKAERERLLALEKLEESEERLRVITETAQDAIIYLGEKGAVFLWNKRAEEMFGYSCKEVMGQDLYRLIVPGRYHERVYKGLKDFARTGSGPLVGTTSECVAMHKGGEEFPVELSVSPVKVKGAWHATGIIRDIRERKIREEDIRRQKEFLKTVFDSINHPFYVIDADDFTVKMVNAAMSEDFREGIKCYELTHNRDSPCDGKDHLCLLNEVKTTGKPTMAEHVHFDSRGNPINVEVYSHPVFDEKGEVVQVIEYAIDVTKRKKMEEDLNFKIDELERFNKLMVGRELKMGELKDENKCLKEEIEKLRKR